MISEKIFKNPPAEDRIKPFWFWNSKLERDELLRQIDYTHENATGGVFMHARFGLETEYLSKEWFDCIRLCIERAEQYSMEVWIYDENPFPSGIGGLKVSKQPSFRSRYIDCIECFLKAGDRVLPSFPGKVLSVQCIRESGLKPLPFMLSNGRVNLKEQLGEDTKLAVFVERILKNPNDKIFGIDYMNEDAVRYFFETTHEVYAKNLGEYFGKTIKGIFTDEPTLLPWHQDINWYIARGNGRVVPWNEKVYEILNQRYGYNIDTIMAAVFYSDDSRMQDVRRNFWAVVGELYEKNFFKLYSEWCRSHGLVLTGHVLLEEGMYFNTIFQGNIIKNLEYFDMPGVDHLTKTAEENGLEFLVGNAPHIPKMKTNIQGQKLVVSAAHLSGNKKVLSESFGVSGWGLSIEDMKWIVNWQYVLGINQLCPHAFFYSIEGFRKSDAPPCHMHNSNWKHYKIFADYVARLSHVLSRGVHRAHVALLYPLSSFQSVYVAGLQQKKDKDISDLFDTLCEILPKIHHDYDVIGEHHLLEARIADGRLKISDEEFKLLLVPSLEGLSEGLKEKIECFGASGGNVIIFNQDEDDFQVTSDTGKESDSRKCYHIQRLDLDRQEQREFLKEKLKELIPAAVGRHVAVEGEDSERIYYMNRSLDDEEIYFFVNTSRDHEVDVDIYLPETGYPVIYNTETGEVEYFDTCNKGDGGIRFSYKFLPCDSLLLGIRKKGNEEAEEVENDCMTSEKEVWGTEKVKSIRLGDGEWQFSLEGYNVLPLNEWKFSIRTHGGGTTYTYETDFEVISKADEFKLMLDDIEYRKAFMGLMDLRIFVNGERVSGSDGYYIDKKFVTFPITGHVKEGVNRITIVINHSSWSDEPHLLTSSVKLLGNFSLKQNARGYSLESMSGKIRLGPWTEQGYPFYSGTASYTREFCLNAIPKASRLYIEGVADCVEIYVNGQYAGTRVWAPWELSITPYLKEGINTLTLKVTNSLINFIESKPKPSGLLKDVVVLYAE